MADDELETGEGEEAPPAPPEVVLFFESGWEPKHPEVGQEITVYWHEKNIGGPTPDTYHAKILYKLDETELFHDLVECSKLEPEQEIRREFALPAPPEQSISYSIDVQLDVDHHEVFSEGYNSFHSGFSASEPFGS